MICDHVFLFIALFFFFNDTPTTEIYTLSLHDALPIFFSTRSGGAMFHPVVQRGGAGADLGRSEEHTSELQSRPHLVCRLLLEKKKKHVRLLLTLLYLVRVKIVPGLCR